MKAIIAAGGRGTRLRPITYVQNKHLVLLANKPMLEYPILKLRDAGIEDIIISVNPGELDLIRGVFGDGEKYGVKLSYIEQNGGPKGIAHVVANAEEFLRGEKFVFFLGDNVTVSNLTTLKEKFESNDAGCLLSLARIENPNRFGVPRFDSNKRIVEVIEKPDVPPSNYAVSGIYFFDEKYFDAFKTIEPSDRGEYEIASIINWYLEHDKVDYEEITGWWKDTGTFESLLEANVLLLNEFLKKDSTSTITQIDTGAKLQGNIYIGKNTKLKDDVLIRGPVVIGNNCILENCYIGPYTSVADNTEIRNTSLDYSIVLKNVKLLTSKHINGAIIGNNAVIKDKEDKPPIHGQSLIIGDNAIVEL